MEYFTNKSELFSFLEEKHERLLKRMLLVYFGGSYLNGQAILPVKFYRWSDRHPDYAVLIVGYGDSRMVLNCASINIIVNDFPLEHKDLFFETYHKIVQNKDSELVPFEIRIMMSFSLTCYTIRSINKFIAGQVEHGGDIRSRNLPHERRQEGTDSFWYGESDDYWPPIVTLK